MNAYELKVVVFVEEGELVRDFTPNEELQDMLREIATALGNTNLSTQITEVKKL